MGTGASYTPLPFDSKDAALAAGKSEEEIIAWIAANTPANYIGYEPRPESTESSGQFIWLTGGTGSGKSTIAGELKKTGNFIFYEGDCFMFHLNPYRDTAPNGAGGGSPLLPERLKGIPRGRIQVCKRALNDGFMKISQGASVDFSVWADFYKELCADVLRERERLGPGWNFVIANAVYTVQTRDLVRQILGPELKFVVLDIDVELQSERIASRFGMPLTAAPGMKKCCKGFEIGREDEVNTCSVKVEREKTLEHITEEVLAVLEQ